MDWGSPARCAQDDTPTEAHMTMGTVAPLVATRYVTKRRTRARLLLAACTMGATALKS